LQLIANSQKGKNQIMSENMIKQLREASYVKGKQRTWVSELNDNQLYELFLRLRNGENAKSIARHIKKSCKAMRDSTIHSISKGVLKFKNRIEHLLVQESPGGEDAAIQQPENIGHLNGIERLEYLADRQLKRILAMMKEEEKAKIRNVNISREIDSLTAFQKAVAKAKEVETENTKEMQPNNPSFNGWVKATCKEATFRTKSMTDQEKIDRLKDAADMVHTMMKINIGTRILGKKAKQEFIEKYPSLERFMFKDSDIIEIPPEKIKEY